MSWSRCSGPAEFLERRGEALLAEESRNNLAWAALHRAEQRLPDDPGYTFLTFDACGSWSAHAFIKQEDRHLVMGVMSDGQRDALVDFLGDDEDGLHVLEGPRDAVLGFVERWREIADGSPEVQMKQGLYELTRVRMPELDGGRLVPATDAHRDVLRQFVSGFWRDCFPKEPITEEMIHARVERFLRTKRAFLWCDRDAAIVSMAAIVRESPNTTSISGVYTPPDQRGRGYAARVVAALSRARLEAGKKACNLHTDLENSTSNGVYIRIGYQLIGEFLRVRLVDSVPNGTSDCIHSG